MVSVLAALALAWAWAAPVPALRGLFDVPFSGPVASFPDGAVAGALDAEAEAVAPGVPITSTYLFTLALNCESSRCS